MEKAIETEAAESMLAEWQDHMGSELPAEQEAVIIKAIEGGRLDFDTDSETFTLILRKPVKMENGDQIETLEIDEPTAEQMERSDKAKDDYGQVIKLISAITGHPEGVIRRMKARDLNAAGAVFGFFG